MIILVHCLLSLFLFFLVNFIGKHSYPVGYTRLSLYPQIDNSLAFNFLLKVFGPLIYLVVVASIFYNINLEKFVKNIYLVSVYYALIRLVVIIITNKTKFISWTRYFLYQSFLVVFSYFVDKKLISEKTNILPDLSTISNELWLLILIFLYHIINNIEFSNASSVKRKEKYIRERYCNFSKLYGSEIKVNLRNEKLEALFFAIMIFEDFNRPKVIRFCEYIRFFLLFGKKSHTLGLMQYKVDNYINDAESVTLALKKIKDDYELLKGIPENKYEWSLVNAIIQKYNGGDLYWSEIDNLYNNILKNYYPNTQDYLIKLEAQK